MKAWLITWEGNHAEPLDRVAGFLNPLWGAQRVGAIVEFLYARACYDLDGMAYQYAEHRCIMLHYALCALERGTGVLRHTDASEPITPLAGRSASGQTHAVCGL